MVKLIYCMRRLCQLSIKEFQDHWSGHHSQYARHLKPLRRYVQYHTLPDTPVRGTMQQAGDSDGEPFDGFAVAWWDSTEAMQAEMTTNPRFPDAVDDMKFFIDKDRSVGSLTQEHVFIEPEGAVPYVLIACLRRRSDIDRATFQKAWLNHGDTIAPRAQGMMMGYIQNHTLLEGDVQGLDALHIVKEPWDGIGMAYFDSIAKFKAMAASNVSAQDSFQAEKRFIDHSQSSYALVRRHVSKDIVR